MIKSINSLLSFIYPITVELDKSEINPVLEVVLNNGRYILNSENTNYSFGSLHILFRKIFRKVDLDWRIIKNVLILGFGTGSIARIIRDYSPDCDIVGVEIDQKVIKLGEKYFDSADLPRIQIVCDNGYDYVLNSKRKFDLVIIDVFIDRKVPDEFETKSFFLALKDILNVNGDIIFNKVIYCREFNEQIPVLKSLYEECFGQVNIYTIMHTGKIFFCKNQ
jgi:tRNA A58 N-methylase Trm61